jgi:surface antigen
LTFATLTHTARRLSKTARIGIATAGALGLLTIAPTALSTTAHASPARLSYHGGYSVQNGWLCYGWANGAYHCTQRFHRSGSRLVSDNPAWVPNYGSTGTTRTVVQHVVVHHSTGGGGGGGGVILPPPANIGQWVQPPGLYAYRMGDFRGDPYSGYFGACTWYAWSRHQGEPLMQLGMASQWAYNAPRYGLRTGYSPAVGATAVFQPGVQGASGGGHAAHVEAVYGNGWFLVSEMSFYWNGGGWGIVSYRYAHTGPGVSFIY